MHWKCSRRRPGGVPAVRDEASGDVTPSQERDDEVGEVAADALPSEQRRDGTVGRSTRARDVGDALTDPAGDGIQERAPLEVVELSSSECVEPVALAVPARAAVADEVDVVDRRRARRIGDRGSVVDHEETGLDAVADVETRAVVVEDLAQLERAAVECGDQHLLHPSEVRRHGDGQHHVGGALHLRLEMAPHVAPGRHVDQPVRSRGECRTRPVVPVATRR